MREVIIIETESSKKIKTLLDKEKINYQVIYDQIVYNKDLTEEEV